MHRRAVLCCALFLLTGALRGAWAESRRSVRFETSPDNAEVWLMVTTRDGRGIYLGRSGTPLLLDVGRLVGAGGFYVEFRAAGCRPQQERIDTQYFNTHDRFPAAGVIRLDFVSPFSALRWYLVAGWPLWSGVLLAMLATWWLWWRPRQQQWQAELAEARRLKALDELQQHSATSRQQQFGSWVLLDLLGEGGTADVYRAVAAAAPDHNEFVAVKVIRRHLANDPTFRKRFEREARIACDLVHPNIARTLDWGEVDGQLYLVTQYLPGETLRARIVPEGLRLADFAALLLPVMASLAYAHERGIVHRDVKPDNILVTEDEVPHLVDFGLARQFDEGTVTTAGVVWGTVNYMAPERLLGIAADPASDQYSVGVLAYEMLAGHRPWQGQPTLAERVLPLPPHELRADVDAELTGVVLRMLAPDPKNRYSSMQLAREALERCAALRIS